MSRQAKKSKVNRVVSSKSGLKDTGVPERPPIADSGKNVRREHAGAAAVIVAATAILFAPVFQGRSFSMVAAHMYSQYPWSALVRDDPSVQGRGYPQTDHAETFYPLSVFATHAVRSGQLPMWLPYSFGGIPVMELGMTGLLYPPRLVLMLMFDPIDQHDLLLIIHLLMAGLGMYGLLRCWGANAIGAIFGAIVWQMNGNNLFWLMFETIPIVAGWFPVMLLCATLAVRRLSFRWAVGAGTAVGMAILSGGLHYAYLSGLVLGGWYLAQATAAALRHYREGHRRSAILCLTLPVCSAAVALAFSAAYWLPLTEWLSGAHREQSSLLVQVMGGSRVSEIFGALIKPLSASGVAGKPADYASFCYTGVLTLVFALPGLLALFRRPGPVILGTLVCALSLGFALGIGPLIIVFRAVFPFFGTIHPSAGFYLYCFGIAIMAAFGITEVSRYLARVKLPKPVPLAIGFLLIAFQTWQLIGFAWTITPAQPKRAEWLYPETPGIAALKNSQGEYHILPVSNHLPSGKWTPPVLTGKSTADFDLRSGSGYESLLPVWVAGTWRTVEQGGQLATDVPPAFRPTFFHDKLPFDLLEKLSVGLLAVPPLARPLDISGRDPTIDGALQLIHQGSDLWIYRLTHALPRAFVVRQVVAAADPPESLRMLVDKKFDAHAAAIVIGEQNAAEAALSADDYQSLGTEAKATILSDRLNSIEIEATTAHRAMLVLNDSWAPGWKAYVDGISQPVLRTNYAFRGVILPEGQHRVVFLYRPVLLLVGLGVSGMTMLLLIVFFGQIELREDYLRANRFLRRWAGPAELDPGA